MISIRTEGELKIVSITNANKMCLELLNLGATITKLVVPTVKGAIDVALGLPSYEDYRVNSCFLGSVVGPLGNRTKNAIVKIDGVEYKLPVNENGNNLHTDFDGGLHKMLFDVVEDNDNRVSFVLDLKDGDLHLPGNRKVKISYTLTDGNEIYISYRVLSDKNTLWNSTNHNYFNLNGHASGDVLGHKLELNCSRYTSVDDECIPFGKLDSVENTPFDYYTKKRKFAPISDAISASENNQIAKVGGGIDHNYAVDGGPRTFRYVGTLVGDKTGINMEVYSDMPGVQIYTGNNLNNEAGKDGATYSKYAGICLETQYFPNCCNERKFMTPSVTAGDTFVSVTRYSFS